MPLERAAAVAVRLLDLGYFRIGNDYYADTSGTFGLTTLERHHVRRHGSGLVFRFVGKSGIEHLVTIDDPDAIAALQVMRTRRDGGSRLLAYRGESGWQDLASGIVNAYLNELFEGEFTAKDFRTWHATVIAAETLALSPEPRHDCGRSQAGRETGAGRGGRLPRKHPGRGEGLLRRSSGHRPVRDRHDHRGRCQPHLPQPGDSPRSARASRDRATRR